MKCLLDPIYIAKRLIASNATNEFYIYKTSQIDFGESVFDDLLELICGTIARNADIESRKLFDYIFRWLSIHIDKIKPTQIRLEINDEPPCEINGKGIPVRGRIPIAAPIFSKIWNKIIMINPVEI